MTWWTLSSMYLGPGTTSAALNCRTSQPDHLFVKWAPWQPRRHPLWRMFRGKEYLCGYKYIWDTPNITEQQLHGDTDFHLFVLTDLTPSTTYWGYMFAPDGPYGQEIQGPLFSFTTTTVGPPPLPTPHPLPIDIANPVFRCGNRYTFWANATWYAFVPSIFSLTMWKLIPGAMVRQDHAHEPTAPAGLIQDADSRMDPFFTTIHCAYFCLVAQPGPNQLRYATFDLTSDSWATDEQICQPQRQVLTTADTCLALDTTLRPHVLYTDYAGIFPEIHYRNRITGSWSAPETALALPGKLNLHPSMAIDPATTTVHLVAVMNTSQHYYRNRPSPAGPWSAITQLDFALNLSHHSIVAPIQDPRVAQLGQDWRINNWNIFDGTLHDDDLTAPTSTYANAVAIPAPGSGPLIAFRDDDNHLAYIWRPPAAAWQAQVQLDPANLIILTAHGAYPDVVSCLYTKTLPIRCAFFAFYAPWH